MNTWRSGDSSGWVRLFRFLGLEVGVIKTLSSSDGSARGVRLRYHLRHNNEFGFDYLRDNLAFRLEDRVQRQLSFAIVDEVDSILIDEAARP